MIDLSFGSTGYRGQEFCSRSFRPALDPPGTETSEMEAIKAVIMARGMNSD